MPSLDSQEHPVRHHHLVLHGYDPDRLREVIAGGSMEQIILNPVAFDLDVRHWSAGGFQVERGHYSSAVLARGQFPGGRLSIGFVRRMDEPTWINGYEVSRDDLQIYPEGVEMVYRAGSNVSWCVISVARECLQRSALARLGRELDLPTSGVLNVTPAPGILAGLEQVAMSSFDQVTGRAEEFPRVQERLTCAIVEAIASATPGLADAVTRDFLYREGLIKRADSFLRQRIGQPYSSGELCEFLGMSERSLQLHFQQALGMSPKKWFQRLCLHRAHLDLRRARAIPGIVTEIAMKNGFEHFGRFAKGYKHLYGELPSQTVKPAPSK